MPDKCRRAPRTRRLEGSLAQALRCPCQRLPRLYLHAAQEAASGSTATQELVARARPIGAGLEQVTNGGSSHYRPLPPRPGTACHGPRRNRPAVPSALQRDGRNFIPPLGGQAGASHRRPRHAGEIALLRPRDALSASGTATPAQEKKLLAERPTPRGLERFLECARPAVLPALAEGIAQWHRNNALALWCCRPSWEAHS